MRSERYFTVAALADRLAVSKLTVRRLIASGKIPAIHVGRAVRISPSVVESFLLSVIIGPTGLPDGGKKR